jgi:hypothetical protein
MAFTNFLNPYGSNTSTAYSQNAAPVAQTLAQQPSAFAQAMGQMYGAFNQGYGSYNQGLSSLGNSYANNYGAMAGGIGQIANALGNTWNNAQANNPYASSAEAARQMAVSNLGSSALTSYGNVAGSGLQAWAQQQNGYQKSLSDMSAANQQAVSSLGQSRNNALAGLGGSASKLGIGQAVASAIPGLSGGSAGMPFNVNQGYGALDKLRGDINSRADADQLGGGYGASLASLNMNQAAQGDYPRQQIGDSYRDIRDLNSMNLDASSRGMDQFYANYGPYQNQSRMGQTIPTGSLLEALTGGYSDSANRITGAQSDMRSGWGDSINQYGNSLQGVNTMFNNTIGKSDAWMTPAEQQQMQFQMDDAQLARNRALMSQYGGAYGYGRAMRMGA